MKSLLMMNLELCLTKKSNKILSCRTNGDIWICDSRVIVCYIDSSIAMPWSDSGTGRDTWRVGHAHIWLSCSTSVWIARRSARGPRTLYQLCPVFTTRAAQLIVNVIPKQAHNMLLNIFLHQWEIFNITGIHLTVCLIHRGPVPGWLVFSPRPSLIIESKPSCLLDFSLRIWKLKYIKQ